MIRKFLSDVRGNYALLTAAAIVPIMGGLALAVDYAEMSRQRQQTLNALDAAGIATARRYVEGASGQQLVDYANDFFRANLDDVDPEMTNLNVILPNSDAGGGTVKLTAELRYKPYFLPTFKWMVGDSGTDQVNFAAQSQIKLKNTLEVALVLDNSGSMDYYGSGSGKKRIELLKEASKELVDTLALQAQQLQQVEEPVRFALVPFAASVNVGPDKASATWMDQDGISPIHHQNFDWNGTMGSGNKRVQKVGDIYYKKGSGWGDEEDDKVTRFTLFNEMKSVSSWSCTGIEWRGNCYFGDWVPNGSNTVFSWQGCVEARPYPYNINDAPPSSATPATLYVPMFGPDETDRKDGSNRSAEGNYWNDVTSSSNDLNRQRYMPKYFTPGTSSEDGWGEGPNRSCTTKPITPLTDVTNAAGKTAIKNAIDAMSPLGATNVPEGMAWGWRVVSGGAPFTEGRPDSENGNDKVVIVLTDGANTYYTPGSLGYNDLAGNKSVYSSYGYTGQNQPGASAARLFLGTSAGTTDYSNGNYTDALNDQFAALCDNAKDTGLIVMTVALDLSTSDNAQKEQIDSLKACASESRFRRDTSDPSKPAKLFWNAKGGDLSDTFKEIADELSNLRIAG